MIKKLCSEKDNLQNLKEESFKFWDKNLSDDVFKKNIIGIINGTTVPNINTPNFFKNFIKYEKSILKKIILKIIY